MKIPVTMFARGPVRQREFRSFLPVGEPSFGPNELKGVQVFEDEVHSGSQPSRQKPNFGWE